MIVQLFSEMFVVVHYEQMRQSFSEFDADDIYHVTQQLQPHEQMIKITGLQKMNQWNILSEMNVDEGDFLEFLEHHLANHPPETQFLQADQHQSSEQKETLASLVDQVKDR